ncbi:MAG: hypothetical protein U9N57_10430, partial [Pseudomonadota bacterium]|nr:hypothetical protein [Pseudomonadota bacterium]
LSCGYFGRPARLGIFRGLNPLSPDGSLLLSDVKSKFKAFGVTCSNILSAKNGLPLVNKT